MSTRCCSRNSCREPAVATLTYVYATSTAVVGPLAIAAEPHAYDLCQAHAHRLTIPRGWELVRYDGDLDEPPASADDLIALAEAVREPGPAVSVTTRTRARPDPTGRRRGHLRIVRPSG